MQALLADRLQNCCPSIEDERRKDVKQMNRRSFIAAGIGSSVLAGGSYGATTSSLKTSVQPGTSSIRSLFPRARQEVFLNAAGGTPLSTFSREGLKKYQDFWELGPADGRADYPGQVLSEIRGLFARLIGAETEEIGLIHSTKAGEQIILDSLPAIRNGANIVTNDLHFGGSIHNLVGLRKAGRDIRIVRNRNWRVDPQEMEEAMDSKTGLLAITLLSNLNGHLEDIRRLADRVHGLGGYVYVDIIQAAGIYPLSMQEMGIDFAACSGYKWLFGPHGCGFLYVKKELQGTVLPDHLFPGHIQPNYPPFVGRKAAGEPEYGYHEPVDARRYQPGHISYLGYCAVYEGLKFLGEVGVERALQHSLDLNRYLKDQLDPKQFPCLSPHWEATPIITFGTDDPNGLSNRLQSAGVVVSVSNNRFRVSPAVYNTKAEMEQLV